MTQSIENLKQEISEAYIKEFKKELGWLKSLTLLPIENKVKNILIGKVNLPQKFNQIKEFGWWKNIIEFITPSIATKIFDFMKEKSQELQRRRTENDLQDLKNEILGQAPENSNKEEIEKREDALKEKEPEIQENTPEEEIEKKEDALKEKEVQKKTSSMEIGMRFSLYGTPGIYGLGKLSNRIDRSLMEKSLDVEKIKETISGSIKQLEDQRDILGSRLTDAQVKTINKHLSKMREGLEVSTSDISTALKEWQKLGNKFPGTLLESAGLSVSQINKIQNLAGELYGKSAEEMKFILKNNGINDIGDELLQTLGKAGSPKEIESMTKILRHGSRINRFMQTMSGAMLVDVAFLGLDVWMFIEQRREAELIEKVNQARASNKHTQALAQLGIGVSSVLIEAAIIGGYLGGISGGPVGAAVGIAVGSITGIASVAVDSLYFDVHDFFLQNKDDFLRQKKSRITEAILQGVHNYKKGNTTINEKIGGNRWIDSKEKKNSTDAAVRALLFLDELDGEEFGNYTPFWEYINKGMTKEDYLKETVSGLPEKDAEEVRINFEEHRVKMENKIARRMRYMKEIFKKDDIITALKSGNGINSINELCVESRIYAKIGQEKREGDMSRESYKTNLDKLKSDFFKDFSPQKIKKLEKLKENDPTLFEELISSANYYSLLKEDETDINYLENVKLVQKYQERLKITQINADKIGLHIEDTQRNMKFIESVLRADFDLNKIIEYKGNDSERVINIINRNFERRGTMEVSDDVWQNILYRLAKELYNYEGENSKEGIMAFFDEGNDGVHGIYYSDGWKMNRDGKLDVRVYNQGIDKIFSSENEVREYVKNFMKYNFTDTTVYTTGPQYGSTMSSQVITTDRSTIDTPTEAIDKDLQLGFKRIFEEILTQELMQRTTKNQENIKKEILDFVKKYSKGEYIELPYYLVIKARKSGLGNMERQFLKRDDGHIELCTLPTELGNNPLGAKINYVTKAREGYTEEEQIYINRVEDAQKKLSNLFNFQGGILRKGEKSDLNIPREVKGLVSDKYKEWNSFKERLLLYSPDVLTGSNIMQEYNQSAQYFENLYRGMLISLTTYKLSNNIDSYQLFQQTKNFGNLNYFGENGEIKTDLNIDFFKNKDIKSFYNEQIKKQKIKYVYNGEKKESTVENLRKSEETEEKSMAKRASNLIIMTIVEQGIIEKSSSGEINRINICGHRKDSDLTKGVKERKNETESLIADRLKNIKGTVLINRNKIQINKQTIQSLTKKELETINETINIGKVIEDTAKNIERQNERGNIIYDQNKRTIKSRGNEINIEISNKEMKNGITKVECQLNGLSEKLNIEEGLRLANFRNRARKKYKGKKVEVGKGKHIIVGRDTLVIDSTRIISRETLDKKIPSFNSDEGRERIANWLTKQIS